MIEERNISPDYPPLTNGEIIETQEEVTNDVIRETEEFLDLVNNDISHRELTEEERQQIIDEAIAQTTNHVMETIYGDEEEVVNDDPPLAQQDEEITNEDTILSPEEQDLLDTILEEAHQEIPTNSGSLLVDESTSRFSSAIWYEKIQQQNIILAGVGGIGSYVGFLLARMRPASLYIYDPDTVETVNMSGQLYGQQDVGAMKVNALSNMMRNYANYSSTFALPERFTMSSGTSDIMICGFDNMSSRKVFFESWLNHVDSKPEEEKKNCLFIDGRLAAEELQTFCIAGDDIFSINRYRMEHLFSDAEADETICSYKQTTFMANMIGSLIVNLFVNFIANQCNPLIDRDLPFYTEYSAETMYFKTIS